MSDYNHRDNDGPAKCEWTPNKEGSPHVHQPFFERPPIMSSALDAIGHTPLIRINQITKEEGVECEILAKCEFFNAGGSVKDRIGKRMVEDAERAGRIKPGDTLIEPTSGNTGIGLALAAALKGYRMVITLPEKMSQEKVDVLKGLGAEIIRTPTEAAWDSPESHISVAKRLNEEIPNSHILDQYSNPSNPLAHYDQTAEELIRQCDGKIDYAVIGAGTGGTLTGIARKLREKVPGITIVGVDPEGSILALPEEINKTTITQYKVEGTGYDFIPAVCERNIAHEWIKTVDQDSFTMARRLIRQEGLLCGGSSGAHMWAAIEYCKRNKIPKGKRVVVILPDGVRNYMTKFLNDDWMVDNGFLDRPSTTYGVVEQWSDATVSDLKLGAAVSVNGKTPVGECADLCKRKGYDQLPVVNDAHKPIGIITEGQMLSRLLSGKCSASDTVESVMLHFAEGKYQPIHRDTKLEALQGFFENHSAGFVTDKDGKILHVVTKIDLLNFMLKK